MSIAAAQPFCRHIADYPGLLQTVRDRAEEMRVSRLELDRIAGLASGHSGKLWGPNSRKTFGMRSLGDVLQTLGLVLIAVEDPNARDRTLSKRQAFDSANRRPNNSCNPCKTVPQIEGLPPTKVEAPKPRSNEQVSRAHLHVVQPRLKGARWGGAI